MNDGHERRDDRIDGAHKGDVFEAAFRRSSTPTMMIDLRAGAGFGRIIEMNDAAEALLGRASGDLIGREATALIPEHLRPTLARNLRLLAGTRRFRRTAARRRVVHADGREIDVWMSSNPIADESGGVAFVWTEIEDLASAQEHRAIVARTERRYLRAFEDAPVAIAWLRLDGPDAGRFLRANGAFTRAVGYAEVDLTAMRAADLAVGQPDLFDPDRIRNVLDATGATTHATCQIRHGSGELRWMRFSFGVQRDDTAAIEAAIVHAEDITASREAQIAARVARERHATVFAQAPTALLLIDLTAERLGCVLEANPAAAALFGHDVSVLAGMSVPELTHPDDRARGRELMGSVAANASPIQRVQRRYLHASGRTIMAEANLAVVPDEHGRARYGIAQIVDVTEQRATEARLRQAERLESVGRLAGGIAHDVNNLLAATMGYANLLTLELNELTAPDEASRAIIERLLVDAHEVEKVALRGAGLTRQLLTFSRGDPSPTTVVDVNAVLVEMRSLVDRSIGENIRVQWDLVAAPTPVLVDRARLEQLVMNLVLNARDAMPLGGSLSVSTSLTTALPAADAPDGDGAPPIGSSVQLLVSDSGSGMSSQEIDRAFEPFFTTKPPGRGNGLGLATVYGIVQAASGRIDITSVAGNGTTVQVLLPRCDGPLSAQPEEPPVLQRRRVRGTVLLVEDEPAVRRPTAELLRQHGFVVLTAADAAEAIERAGAADAIDILISDLVLPGRSGRELAIDLRHDRPGLPVVFISGYSDEVISKHGTIEPHDVLLAKPFTIDALLAAMWQLLEPTGVTSTVG